MSEENQEQPYTADDLKKMAGKEEPLDQTQPNQTQPNQEQYVGMGNPTTTYEAAQPAQPEVPSDIVELPSQGYFYPSGKSNVRVAFMMLQDENVLTSPNLLQDGRALDILLDRKIMEKDINRKQLLTGDRDEILMFLRSTGLGDEYTFPVTDPQTNKSFNWTVTLSKLKRKYPETLPDNDGCYSFTLPTSGKVVRYSFLTVGEEEEIKKADEDRSNYYNESRYVTLRLAKQIKEIDGISNRGEIENIVEWMPLLEARKLRNEINRMEPGLDMRVTVTTPTNQDLTITMPITEEFFFPAV